MTYRDATTDFVRSTQSIIGAVDMLKTAIAGGDSGDIQFATGVLSRAADEYAGNTAQYARLGFEEISAAPETALPQREHVATDLLASALLDLGMANTLIASQIAAESPSPATLADLEEASGELHSLASAVALPLGKEIEPASPAARFGFEEVASVRPRAASADLPTAKASFEQQVLQMFDTLVGGTKKVIQVAFKEVADLDQAQIAEAIGRVGRTAGDLPQVGRLVTKGLMFFIQALEKITGLIGSANVNALQEQARALLKQIEQGGSMLDQFLNYSYGVAATKERVKGLLGTTTADVERVNDGTQRLAALQVRFAEQMAIVGRLVSGLNLTRKLAARLLPGAVVDILLGSFYIAAMDYAVLAGMDYADTTTLITLVAGVVKIMEETLV